MRRLFLMISLLASLFAQAQQTHLSGFVSDANDGERIIGANVFLQDRTYGQPHNPEEPLNGLWGRSRYLL